MTAVRVRQSAGQASCSGQRCSQGSSIQRCKITSEGFPYGISTEFSQFFREPPIEPVRTISVRSSCHWRHVFLVALAWGRRASEIHAFSGKSLTLRLSAIRFRYPSVFFPISWQRTSFQSPFTSPLSSVFCPDHEYRPPSWSWLCSLSLLVHLTNVKVSPPSE